MKLKELLHIIDKSPLDHLIHIPNGCEIDSIEINGMVCDSRKAAPGMIFAATKGGHSDGYDFIEQAVEGGAQAVLCERRSPVAVPQIIMNDVRSAMGYVCSQIHDNPSKKMTMVALTGTNGKTTSAFMTQAILQRCGIKTGLVGTVLYDDGAAKEEAEHTTPEGADLQNIFARMVSNGCKACVMEVSSHSLVQGRVSGTSFDRAGFTNLTIEHLDFHLTMEEYFKAKKILFEKYMRNNWQASVNIDDDYGLRLSENLGRRALTYGIVNESADFFASIKNISLDGLEIEIKTPKESNPHKLRLPLLGAYNVLNALQSLSLAWSVGIPLSDALDALANMPQVPGRLERYKINGGGTSIIDFAHSSDGLEKVLTAVRPICKGRLIVVFGAGGDRDRTKRPIMGEVASRLADFVVVTSDNPRSEEPMAIISEILPGVRKHNTEYSVTPDRREAIYEGLDMAGEEDVVVIAGRGHETIQILKDGPIHLVDKEIVTDWCALRGKEIE